MHITTHGSATCAPPFEVGDDVVALREISSYKRRVTMREGQQATVQYIGFDGSEWYLNFSGVVDAFPASAFTKHPQ